MSSCVWAPFLKECYEYGPIVLSVGDKAFLLVLVVSLIAIGVNWIQGRFD